MIETAAAPTATVEAVSPAEASQPSSPPVRQASNASAKREAAAEMRKERENAERAALAAKKATADAPEKAADAPADVAATQTEPPADNAEAAARRAAGKANDEAANARSYRKKLQAEAARIEAARAEVLKAAEDARALKAELEATRASIPQVDFKNADPLAIAAEVARLRGVPVEDILRGANTSYVEKDKPESKVRELEQRYRDLEARMEAEKKAEAERQEQAVRRHLESALDMTARAAVTTFRTADYEQKHPVLSVIEDHEITAELRALDQNGTMERFRKQQGRMPTVDEFAEFLDEKFKTRYDRITSRLRPAVTPGPATVAAHGAKTLSNDAASNRATSGAPEVRKTMRDLKREAAEELRAERLGAH